MRKYLLESSEKLLNALFRDFWTFSEISSLLFDRSLPD